MADCIEKNGVRELQAARGERRGRPMLSVKPIAPRILEEREAAELEGERQPLAPPEQQRHRVNVPAVELKVQRARKDDADSVA